MQEINSTAKIIYNNYRKLLWRDCIIQHMQTWIECAYYTQKVKEKILILKSFIPKMTKNDIYFFLQKKIIALRFIIITTGNC